jgi:GPH family glycoside/pentoside/hexuronide:cation symporter
VPQDKVRALAWFVTSLIVVAGAVVAWVVGGFDVSPQKQARIREQLAASRGA